MGIIDTDHDLGQPGCREVRGREGAGGREGKDGEREKWGEGDGKGEENVAIKYVGHTPNRTAAV